MLMHLVAGKFVTQALAAAVCDFARHKLAKLVACCRLGFVNASESLLQ
jgi:hypothetical protein